MSESNVKPGQANPFSITEVVSDSYGKLAAQVCSALLERPLGLHYMAREYRKLSPSDSPRSFVSKVLAALNVNYRIASGNLENLPQEGPTIVVANHPFGGLEGLLMIDILLQKRADVRIMANNFLKRVPELEDIFIGVNPYGHQQAVKENIGAMREGMQWLKAGGVLVIFPAGDVSQFDFQQLQIADREWDRSVVRMARRTQACVLPVYFVGHNSVPFYLASGLHPLLKTLFLPRQLINKRGKRIDVHIGKPVSTKRIRRITDDRQCADYLQIRTYLLAEQQRVKKSMAQTEQKLPVIGTVDTALLEIEIDKLPDSHKLVESGKLQVFYARAEQIPWILQEIGRLRELSFRAAGEGSGKAIDLDLYDEFYLHLFIWNQEEGSIVGGYRLGLADEIVSKYGRKGLYSYSLFKFKRAFLHKINPAIELGRSFVRVEYQRSFTPLMLLWKGIATYVASHPRYAVLFGPVSISDDYSLMSQRVLVDFLQTNVFDQKLGKRVKPRMPFDASSLGNLRRRSLNQPENVAELSNLVSDLENDARGVPVLIRQYLKLGGKMLGFNVDTEFSHVIDGLIKVDLRNTEPATLARYMGADLARAFLAYHADRGRSGDKKSR